MEPGTSIVNYTWSHTIDNLDSRYRIVVSAVRSVASAKKAYGLLKQALDGWVTARILIALTSNPSTLFNSISADFDGLNIYFRVVLPDTWKAGPSHGQNAESRQEPNRYQHVFVPGT